MPDETRNYLPKLQAVKNIVRDPEKYGLELDDIPDAPYFAVVKTTRKIDVKRAAELAEMPLDEFQFLNPQHNRPVIAGADEYTILLPIDKAELFAAKLELTDQPLVSWQAYRMSNGETLQQVAAKFGMPVEALRAVNGIGAKAKVPVGPHAAGARRRARPRPRARRCRRPCSRRCRRAARSTTASTAATRSRGIASRYAVSPCRTSGAGTGSRKARVAVGQTLRITSDRAPQRRQGEARHGAAKRDGVQRAAEAGGRQQTRARRRQREDAGDGSAARKTRQPASAKTGDGRRAA